MADAQFPHIKIMKYKVSCRMPHYLFHRNSKHQIKDEKLLKWRKEALAGRTHDARKYWRNRWNNVYYPPDMKCAFDGE